MYESSASSTNSPHEDDAKEDFRRLLEYLNRLKHVNGVSSRGNDDWERFFRTHSRLLLRMVRSHRGSKDDCDDRVQDLWLALLKELPNLRYDPVRGELRDWISATARNRLVDQDRYRRCHWMEPLTRQAVSDMRSREPDPAASFERSRLLQLVHDALSELRALVSERDFAAYWLRWIDGLSVKQIATRLGMTEPQIWAIHHRISLKFRPILARRLNERI